MQPIDSSATSDHSSSQSQDGRASGEQKKACEWRHGPAALWYEMLSVDDDGSNLDYGFRLKEVKGFF